MRKLLFLDVDGVLNSHAWWDRRPKLEPGHSREEFKKNEFDPEAVKILHKILRETDAMVVLSSVWRLHEESRKDVEKYARIRFTVTGESDCRIRGCEIKQWIDKNVPYKERGELRYAILDDDSDMLLWQKDDFFQTDHKIGLTNEIAERVIAHLNR